VNPTLNALRSEVVKYAKQMAALGLAPNTQGNISARDPVSGLIAITPHDYPYDLMTFEDIAIVDAQGRVVEGRLAPSEETAVHCVVYRERPQINGIVHSEPVYVNCFGALGMPIQPVVVSLTVAMGGEVPVMPFAHSGSERFGYRMLEVMGERNGVIWGNHGLLTVGETLRVAFQRTVAVEHAARVYFLALQLGQPSLVTAEVLRATIAQEQASP
jgi:ribulose-5-phosphate 4-epimerase/fuculose-1-phosphate aldolase